MKTTTSSWACPLCPVWIEGAVTVEHLERAVIEHVDTEHPRYHLVARHAVALGLRPLPLFDTVETAESTTTTCVHCGAGLMIEPPDPESPVLQSFMSEHVALHADVLREGRS